MSPIMGLLPGRPAESLLSRLRRDRHDPAGRTSRIHRNPRTTTAAKRGRKRRAKTDNADCDLQLKLLLAGELPESWIPPAHILELRTRVRMRQVLIDQRTAWQPRLQAQLFHQ